MPITDIHLRTLLERLDTIRENLHLRPLTDREKEDIIVAAGFSTSVSGVLNPIFNRSKKKTERLYTRPKQAFKEKKFKFNIKDPLTVKTRRKYEYRHEIPIFTPIHTNSQAPVNVLIPLTINDVNLLTVLTKIKNSVSEKIIILMEMIYKSLDKISISTFLKSSLLNSLKVSIYLKSKRKSRLHIESPLKSNGLRDRLENQSVYMDDVGQIEEIELLQIIGDISAIRW